MGDIDPGGKVDFDFDDDRLVYFYVCTAEDKTFLQSRSPMVAKLVGLIDGAQESIDIANYTFSEAKDVGLFSQLDGSPLPFPGLSEHSYNLVLYYDKGPVNARVAFNSRTDWLVSAADRSGKPRPCRCANWR